jgi:hypothetical protein
MGAGRVDTQGDTIPPTQYLTSSEDAMPSTLDTPQPDPTESRVVALLHAHIPLSLLLDLAETDPHSHELYAMEKAS